MLQTNKHYNLGLVIGRFQPFHKGHAYLIEKALKSSDKIIIGIGSANANDENNPYSFELRKKMVEKFVHQEKLEDRIIKIFPSEDDPSDNVWLAKTLDNVSNIDIVIGNNDWVNGIFEKAGFEVLYVTYYKRNLYEGWRIRKLMKEGKNWEDRVPDYLVAQIKLIDI